MNTFAGITVRTIKRIVDDGITTQNHRDITKVTKIGRHIDEIIEAIAMIAEVIDGEISITKIGAIIEVVTQNFVTIRNRIENICHPWIVHFHRTVPMCILQLHIITLAIIIRHSIIAVVRRFINISIHLYRKLYPLFSEFFLFMVFKSIGFKSNGNFIE